MDPTAYRWEVKEVNEPGQAPRYQMHLVQTDEARRQTLMEQARYMDELKRKGYITLPPDLARHTGFSRWNPHDKAQTERVLVEMSKQDE